MNVRNNKARETLTSGGAIFSSSLRLPEPGLCEILGYAGFDFVLIDGEHGAVSPPIIDRCVQGCLAGGTVPVVRVSRNDDVESVMLALDLGVQGVLIPHCRTPEDARRLKHAAFYPPDGHRGFGPGRSIAWGQITTEDYFAAINDTVLTLALIEDPEALGRVDEIAAEGLDVLWVGTGDLALSLGVPGQRKHPRVMEAAQTVLDACQKHGVAAGYPAGNADEAAWAVEQGYRAVGFGCAEQYVAQTGRQFLEAMGR